MFQGFDRNLMVFPVNAFEGIYQSISTQNLADPQVRMLHRLILGSAHKLEMSEHGNVTVPQVLKEYANLNGKALLIGQGDFFEIWEPISWEKQESQLKDANTNPARFSSLTIVTHQPIKDGKQ